MVNIYIYIVLVQFINVKTTIIVLSCLYQYVGDGPLEKLWGGGGEGNFRAAGIFFFVNKFLV